jgi:hypothetical protein
MSCFSTLRRDHAELGQMPAQSVHQTHTLAHQPLPATVQQHGSLLVGRLDRHKSRGRSPNRLANRFRIGGVGLVAFDVRLHVLRRHQPHLVANRAQLASPVMRRRTRFQPDHTPGNAAEERQHLPAPQSLTQNRRTLRINAVNLKNMLGYVHPDCRNLAHGWLPFLVILQNTSLARRCRKGAIHPIIRSLRRRAAGRFWDR